MESIISVLFDISCIIVLLIFVSMLFNGRNDKTLYLFRNGNMRIVRGKGKDEFLVQVRQYNDSIPKWVTCKTIFGQKKAKKFAVDEEVKWRMRPK